MPKAVPKKKKRGILARQPQKRPIEKSPAKVAPPEQAVPADPRPRGGLNLALTIRLAIALVALCIFAYMHWTPAP